ncbi:MAG: PDDEXK nuclease domain-containing protein [Bacteroidales bacterium]|nr:PDDEXK nuclease domain-containing protein [Bacteroidales bacterium]
MKDDKKLVKVENENELFEYISSLIEESRRHVAKAVSTAMVYTYYGVGQYIVEFEQNGDYRAAYGKEVLGRLSARLTEKYGKGWSVETLTKCRKFYNTYAISSAMQTKSGKKQKSSALRTKLTPEFFLSWNHYQILMRIENPDERHFYEIEAKRQNWGYRWLQRQYASSLYERIALSQDKDKVLSMAENGQIVEQPSDIIKNPIALEFLGLKPDSSYSESKLENAIISKLQTFLLEMGKGFLFEARQKRFTFNEDNFYVDLVLYNRLLQCYVLVDLKIEKLSHQDLGQMQMYVNYFDRYVKLDFEKPTIGILLCKSKDDALVELTLPKDTNIYASAYELCLPNKTLLQAKMREWIEEFEEINEEK